MQIAPVSFRRSIVTLVSLFALVAVVGCGDSVQPVSDGAVTATWEISPRGCDGAGVEKVRVALKYEAGTRTETFRCEQERGRVENLRPANYKLRIVGLDERGNATFAGGPEKVTVHGGGETTAPRLRLTARPARLEVVWRFGNGMVCGANEVKDVEISVYDADDYMVLSRSFDCTEGRATLEKIPPGDHIVEMRAEGKEETFAGFTEVDASRGRRAEIEVVLDDVED